MAGLCMWLNKSIHTSQCRTNSTLHLTMDIPKDIRDDMEDDLDVCLECTGTWKVACYGAWYPHSQFWKDFLDEEDGWEGNVYSPQACCLRFLCGVLFCFFAPLWCCKAIFFFLCWPCICGLRALKEGNCNKSYFRLHRSKRARDKQLRSQPLAYIESQPTQPVSNTTYVIEDLHKSWWPFCGSVEALTVYIACERSCSTPLHWY